MADHDTHDHTGIPGCGAPTDILDIPTAETDTTLVLAPDGVGGVEFRAETGGGGGGGLVFLGEYVASAQATLDLATRNATGQSGALFQSDFDDYVLRIIDLNPATDNVNCYLRVGTGGTPTYDSGSNYQWGGIRWTATGATGAGGPGTTTQIQLDAGDTIDNAASSTLSGFMNIHAPQAGIANRHMEGEMTYFANAGINFGSILMGAYLPTTSITALRLLFSSGNLTSGKARVYGYEKS